MDLFGLDGKTAARAGAITFAIAFPVLAYWLRCFLRPKRYQHEYMATIEVPTPLVYTATNVHHGKIYRNWDHQYWIALEKSGDYFRVAVLSSYWNGFGRPKIAFKGWTSQLIACATIHQEDLLECLPANPWNEYARRPINQVN